ncbi:MAG TPA: amino acid adenylation domain-containing protein [Verrucomicrobiae bacterium]|nr:amino acid adenylation domain-containing protein [Verrucomicrobiae bacterium]
MSITATELTNLKSDQKRALLEQLLRERSRKPKSFPLSSAQKRLWFLDRLEPNSAVYNVPTVLRLHGPLDHAALGRGLDAVVARHESLRTTFEAIDDSPSQKINATAHVEFPLLDLSTLDGQRKNREAEKVISHEITRPFDLAKDLMIRAMLIRLAPEEHILVLSTHHIASDEWSLRVLLREWSRLYAAEVNPHESGLPELPIQYADFAVWQQDWLQRDACRAQLDYWRKRLEGAPVVQLPTDFNRPGSQTFHGEIRTAVFPAELSAALKRLSQQQESTLFMTLLAAFKVLLFRYTQQDDLVVGCPIAGRNRLETEALIGFFVNTLAIRSQLQPDQSFIDLLRHVRENTLGAYAHQDLPFDRVVEELHPQRSSNHMPLVQVVFSLNNEFVEENVFQGTTAEEIEVSTDTSKFDITFVTKETANGLHAVVEYNSDLFARPRMERMLGHFGRLLQSIVANPHQKIGELQLLPAAEWSQIALDWNRTTTKYPREEGVHQLFEAQVARTPDAIALQFGAQTISYRELNARANQLAHYLRNQKIGPNTLVGVYMERSIEMIIAFLGILKAGAAYVPLDLSYPRDRLAFMIADARMPIILTQSQCLKELPDTGTPLVCLDQEWSNIQQEPRQLPANSINADALAYVIYTSGSTGRPKGVAVRHRGITRLVLNTDYVQIRPSDRIAQASNASFDAATFEIWGALLNGARLIGIHKDTAISPGDFAEALRKEEISILFLTTALFNQLAREIPGVFSTLDTVLFGGELVDPKWVRSVLESGAPKRLLHVYGPTENTTFSTWYHVREVPDDAATVPIGKPIANSELYILDGQQQPVPIGVTGEIYVGGDGLASGYWNRPELTLEKFPAHPFKRESGAQLYRTGDLARFDAEGNVEFVGRIDHQIKLRGFRIELGEIEAELAKHEHVANNVVMLREDIPSDKRLVAYIIPKGATPSAADLRSHLRAHLPDYMVPAAFVFMDTFPLTPNEKIDRKALPVPEQNRPTLGKSFVAPRDSVEQQLAKIWEKILGVQPIGLADNFFDLGGHSLLAVKVFSQIEKVFNKKLPLATLFRAPTIEEIAKVLREDSEAKSWSTIVDIQPKGSKPPFFWIHTLGGDGGGGFFYYRKLAELLGPDQPSFGIRSPREPFSDIEKMAAFYIKDIRKFQPNGPYFLGGFCFGGNVAFEMAQQLVASGQEVGLLVMLESSPPNVTHKQSWSATAAKYSLENLVENVKDFVSHSSQQRFAMLKSKSRRFKEKFRGRNGASSEQEKKGVDLKDVIDLSRYPKGYVQYAETHWQALTQYQPEPYPGELILFRAKKQGLSNFSHSLGWDVLVGDRVNVNVIPGTHESMLQEPNVQIVAAKLRSLLDAARHGPKRAVEKEFAAN